MSMPGHHALLFELAGGVVVVGAVLAVTLTRKKQETVEVLTSEDMKKIGERLTTAEVGRTESRFRKRYGVDARAKDFVSPQEPPKPVEPDKEEPKP